ncbi:HlyC/CorC family transporter [Occultella glacieicola]|uniref:HlyC/CorC family transporter n=1 Tax=Occultella glacieicola TaxID=2518684 RepID=A0ABY2E7L4_9MICO|nr:hemolysin family protein [Occultella glacieicola]TDE96043.1 HlyC/CorC family transporter [Occultella glacieicola]
MSSGTALVVALVLLAANAFFVGAEFAIMSARRSQIEPLAESGSRAARTALWAIENVSLMLACAQLGITICSTGIGAVAEPAIARLVEGPLIAVGLPEQAGHVVGFVVALAIVVYLHVVVGEMVPKNLAVSAPERAVLWFAPPLVWISRVLSPVIRFLNWLANAILRLGGVEPKDEVTSTFTAEEVAAIVERSQAEGLLDDDLGLLTGAIEFSEATAGTVMVGLDALVTLPLGCTPDDVEHAVAKTGYSRFPVTDGDAVIGYLHIKDVLYADSDELRAAPVPDWRVRPMAMAATGDEIEDVLAAMQRTGAHLAAVSAAPDAGIGGGEVLAPGAVAEADSAVANAADSGRIGVVFLEDILEELVGEVRDSMQRAQQR